jgi:hypothetical protein
MYVFSPTASNSSINMIAGAFSLASVNASRTIFAPSPGLGEYDYWYKGHKANRVLLKYLISRVVSTSLYDFNDMSLNDFIFSAICSLSHQ